MIVVTEAKEALVGVSLMAANDHDVNARLLCLACRSFLWGRVSVHPKQ